MDKRLEDALEYSNFRMILSTRQENLKTLLNNKLKMTYGGGLFKVDKEMISFIGVMLLTNQKETIIIDENDIPIKIENIKDFVEKAFIQYNKVHAQYYDSYEKLNEARNIRKVIDWDEEKTEK